VEIVNAMDEAGVGFHVRTISAAASGESESLDLQSAQDHQRD